MSGATYTMTGGDTGYSDTEHHFCPSHNDEVRDILTSVIKSSTMDPARTGLIVTMLPGQTEPPTEAEYWERVRNSAVAGTKIWASKAINEE